MCRNKINILCRNASGTVIALFMAMFNSSPVRDGPVI